MRYLPLESRKENIEPVAVGNYQGEFFESDSVPYFTIYSANGSTTNEKIFFNLSTILVSRASDLRYYILDGAERYEFFFKDTRRGLWLYVYKYYFGRFRMRYCSGFVTSAAKTIIQDKLAKCRQGLAA
ncbi:MAG: hypothetical protein MI746_01930 [Pseudomonadales bacterium]|nr:hypothetical protein [Pseudomonadales bacterium]